MAGNKLKIARNALFAVGKQHANKIQTAKQTGTYRISAETGQFNVCISLKRRNNKYEVVVYSHSVANNSFLRF